MYGGVPPVAEKVVVPPATTWALAGDMASPTTAGLIVMEEEAELEALSVTCTVADPGDEGGVYVAVVVWDDRVPTPLWGISVKMYGGTPPLAVNVMGLLFVCRLTEAGVMARGGGGDVIVTEALLVVKALSLT